MNLNRKLPELDTPPDVLYKSKDLVQIRHYKLITPLYGGGVDPNKCDPVSTIRVPEIRGQLRFWWRALRGNQGAGTIAALKSREEAIWGSTEKPSSVKIALNNLKSGTKFQPQNYRGETITDISDFSSKDSYVAFPLRKQNATLYENIEFDLEISYPDTNKDDIDAAFWAWETFGGIGARTRRGFGALYCEKIDDTLQIRPSCANLPTYITKNLQKRIDPTHAFPAGLPHLTPTALFKITSLKANALEAWRDLINQYKSFRQSRPNRDPRHPGVSYWPAPDVIRRKWPNQRRRHQPRSNMPDKIPRAKFGLPIIFQFKDADDINTTLQGVGEIDRMASPLILKPVKCSDGYVGLGLILEWSPMNPGDELYTPPGGLQLVNDLGSKPVKSDLTAVDAAAIMPMNGTNETNPLKAFLKKYIN